MAAAWDAMPWGGAEAAGDGLSGGGDGRRGQALHGYALESRWLRPGTTEVAAEMGEESRRA
jgi:hypothetical protein